MNTRSFDIAGETVVVADPDLPEGHGGQLAGEAIAAEAARTGLSADMVRACWRAGISVDEGIALARKTLEAPPA